MWDIQADIFSWIVAVIVTFQHAHTDFIIGFILLEFIITVDCHSRSVTAGFH